MDFITHNCEFISHNSELQDINSQLQGKKGRIARLFLEIVS